MKKYGKILCLFAVIFLLAAGTVFSQNLTIESLSGSVDSFSETIAKALPFNSTMGLNWSDAYIGQLIGIPPHFGIGVSTGFTTMPMGSIGKVADLLDYNLPDVAIGFPLPGYTVEARVGGLILPFDVGLKFGYLETGLMDRLIGMNIDYLLFGMDFRYSVFDPTLLPIKISAGLGYNYLSGGVSKKFPGKDIVYDFSNPLGAGTYELTVPTPTIGLKWSTNTIEAKAQVCFPLIIITPYAGAGLSYSWSEAGYYISSNILVDGVPIDETSPHIRDALKTAVNGNVAKTGFERMVEDTGINMRLFGGISLNIAFIKFDITGMFNARDGSWGGTFGTRFQL